VDIASASGTEDPGSNPASKFFRKNLTVLMSKLYLICIVCVFKKRDKGIGPKNILMKIQINT
jgi:hypothetical protein